MRPGDTEPCGRLSHNGSLVVDNAQHRPLVVSRQARAGLLSRRLTTRSRRRSSQRSGDRGGAGPGGHDPSGDRAGGVDIAACRRGCPQGFLKVVQVAGGAPDGVGDGVLRETCRPQPTSPATAPAAPQGGRA